MPTPTVLASYLVDLVDYHSYESGMSSDHLTALATGRYVSSYTYDYPTGLDTFLLVDVYNGDSSVLKHFVPSHSNVNDYPPAGQNIFQVGTVRTTSLSGDRFVAVWDENHDFGTDKSGSGVVIRIYDQLGNSVSANLQANSKTAGNQGDASAIALANGSFVVFWQHSALGNPPYRNEDIRAQVFSATGAKIGDEVQVNTSTAGTQDQQSIVALDGGGFVAVWRDDSHANSDTSGTAIRAQRFAATGTKLGGEVLVNGTVSGSQTDPQIVALHNGGYAIFWGDGNIRGQFFAATGARVGGEILVNTTAGGHDPSVTVLDGGNVVVAWGGGKAQLFSQTGARIGGEFALTSTTANPQVLDTSEGNFLACWTNLNGNVAEVWTQLFNSTGVKIGGALKVAGAEFYYTYGATITSLAELADGRVTIAWTANGDNSVDFAYSNHHAVIDPRQGAVSLSGTAFSDDLVGTRLNDRIFGGSGNDTVQGNGGRDTLDGGAGQDAASYAEKTAAVVVTLNGAGNVQVKVGGVVEETIRGFEGVFGGSAADQLTGDAAANDLRGNAGNDALSGRSGNDSLIGGTGIDTMTGGLGHDRYNVDHASDKVIEAAGGGNDTVITAVSYVLATASEVESVRILVTDYNRFSSVNLTGNAFANAMFGHGGDNILNGVGGNDTLRGGAGDDKLIGGVGNDILVGGLGKDTVTGSAGADRFDFNLITESVAGANRDVVLDFVRAQGDKIDLSTIDADTDGTAGNQAFAFIGVGAFAGVDGQLRCSAGIVQGDVNGDRVADFEIKVNVATLIAQDFVL